MGKLRRRKKNMKNLKTKIKLKVVIMKKKNKVLEVRMY